MRLWKAVVLVNLALGLGVGVGYLRWAAENRALRAALAQAREEATRRESGERTWVVRGIVRSILPRLGVAYLTHEAIPGLMDPMTMGFEAEDAKILAGLKSGDAVQFTLRQKNDRVLLVAIQKTGP